MQRTGRAAGSTFGPCPEHRAGGGRGPRPCPVTLRPQRGRAGPGAQGPRARGSRGAQPGAPSAERGSRPRQAPGLWEGRTEHQPTGTRRSPAPTAARPVPPAGGPRPRPGPAPHGAQVPGRAVPHCRRSGTRPRPRPRRAPPPPSPPTRDRAFTTRDRGARRSDWPRPPRGARGPRAPPCDAIEAAPPPAGSGAGPRLRRRGWAGPPGGPSGAPRAGGYGGRGSGGGAGRPARGSAGAAAALELGIGRRPAGRAGERRWEGRRRRRFHPRGRRRLREETGGGGGAVLQGKGAGAALCPKEAPRGRDPPPPERD